MDSKTWARNQRLLKMFKQILKKCQKKNKKKTLETKYILKLKITASQRIGDHKNLAEKKITKNAYFHGKHEKGIVRGNKKKRV